jgi:hypothetical protein
MRGRRSEEVVTQQRHTTTSVVEATIRFVVVRPLTQQPQECKWTSTRKIARFRLELATPPGIQERQV